MEQRKLDKSSIIGFLLLFGIVVWMMIQNQPTKEEIAADKAKKEQAEKAKQQNVVKAAKEEATDLVLAAGDSSQIKALEGKLGAFAYSVSMAADHKGVTVLENDKVKLTIANKGGYIKEAVLKEYDRFHKDSGALVELINKNNANLDLTLQTRDNRTLHTKDLVFQPTVTKIGESQALTLRLHAGPDKYLEYRYVLPKDDYMLDFDVRTQGLSAVLNNAKPLEMNWDLKAFRNEKSISYENRYTEIRYEYEEGKHTYVSPGKDEKETGEEVSYIAYKQHFFTSILLTKTPFATVDFTSKDLVEDEKKDTVFTKAYTSRIPLAFNNAGEIDYKMNWYYGPSDYQLLKDYDRNIEDIIPLGWGIFGWINKLIFVPLFGFLSSYIAYGIAIIIFTLIIKLAMSPITYRSFLSQAKMKVLRPEIQEINAKEKDPMKRQQATMALYNKAGVNPLAGCIPALIQLPFVYASFQFFPSAIELRQKPFLWADDLSSFDEIAKLPFRIPVYGDHVSLFPILAAIAIFFYMKMTSGDQPAMQQPTQEGMPDMSKVMKIMIYLSPLMMLLFFNNYGSGLSLYNFVSNVVTIGIMFVIKRYVVDEDKIHAQIQENKKKEKPQGKFQKRMQELMEQAEQQKKGRK